MSCQVLLWAVAVVPELAAAVVAAVAVAERRLWVAGTLQIDLVVAAALEVAEAAIARFCTEAAAVEAASIVVGAVASAFAEGVRVGPRGPLKKSLSG